MRTRYPCPQPQGRLTLTSATPVTTSDVTAATTIYYTPHQGELVAIRADRRTLPHVFAELSIALDSNSGHTGYHQTGKNFDVFAFINSDGDVDIGTGPAWLTSTVRGTGAGSTELDRVDGLHVNKVEIQLRTGSGADDLQTVEARGACYLGTFRTTADGQTEDSVAKRYVWNAFNRVMRVMRAFIATDTWAGSAAASWRQFNASASQTLDFLRGLDMDSVSAHCALSGIGSGATLREVRVGIGLDATNAIATGCLPGSAQASNAGAFQMAASYVGLPGLGLHRLNALEYDHASDTRTYYGDNGAPTTTQSGIHGAMLA